MKSKSDVQKKKGYCLITGAAGGLGLQLAKVFSKNGYSLVLIDIDEINLEKTVKCLSSNKDINVISISADLSQNDAAIRIYETITIQNINIEVLINNAGFGYYGLFAENKWEKQESMIKLSVLTTSHLAKLFLPEMLANRKGYILNIASLAAFQPGPLMSVYHASKAFMLSFSQSLANELKDTGVFVTVVCPGIMATGFQKANNNESPRLKWTLGSAEKVAEFCYRSMLKNKVVAIPGLMTSLLANLPRFITRNATTNIVRMIQEKNRRDFKTVN